MISRIGGLLLLIAVLLLIAPSGPVVPPTPPVVVNPAPFVADKLCVMVIEETRDRAKTPAWVRATAAGSVQDVVTKGGGTYLKLDADQTDFSNMPPWVAAAFKVPHPELPWIVGAGPKSGFSQKLPATAAEALKLIEGVKF